jgi:hypothetical protein
LTFYENVRLGILISRGSGLMIDVLILSLEGGRFTDENGELSTKDKYNTELGRDVFDLRVKCRSV